MEYKNSRNLSWEILIREGVNSLPVKTGDICRKMGIIIKEYDNDENDDGFCVIRHNVPYICINRNRAIARKRFTVAHELGHILCGHVGKYELVNREPSPTDNSVEQAANVFAARLLAPACVLWGLGAETTEDIMRFCNISRTAAEFRRTRLKHLASKNRFLSSPLEQQVFMQFFDFIQKKKLKS